MKVVAYYKNRVLADDDHCFLMTKGIASVVYGDAAPAVLEENFGKQPICIAVMDEQHNRAKKLLDERHNSEILDTIKKWTHKVKRNAEHTRQKKSRHNQQKVTDPDSPDAQDSE